ncbi:TPA: NtaA/DmoA family FMN-dependent monooxygenase [Pseudomonas aeruginosa]
MPREIRLNAFEMNCVGHQSPGLWAHPRDRSSQYKDLEYWTDLARLLERGRFDGLFIADVLGIYDVLDGNGDAAIRQAAQVPVNDPLALITPMAAVTRHLGFGLTASLSFEHPYPFARRLSTLDHLTKGRIGWNVVTSYLESGARNLGQQAQLDHDRRYDYADEYLQVLYKLFEGSWEDGAVLRDRRRRIFSDPGKIHEIRHVGEHFQVPGIHLCEPSPQRTPVLYQAGASSRGKRFAAEHAECVFVAAPSKTVLKQAVADIRQRVAEAGRDPRKVLGVQPADGGAGRNRRQGQGQVRRIPRLRQLRRGPGADLRLDRDRLRPVSAGSGAAAHPDQCDPIGGGSVFQRRSDAHLDGPRAGRLGRYRRLRPAVRRQPGDRRRPVAGVGGGHRRGWLQPGLCAGPRNLQRRGRIAGAGVAEARGVQDRICAGDSAREVVRRRPAAAGFPSGGRLSRPAGALGEGGRAQRAAGLTWADGG